MNKKGLKTMLVCIVLLIGLVTLFACNKNDVADNDGQTKVIVKIRNEDGSIYKENVVFSDVFGISLQKEGYTGELYRDADFSEPITKDSEVKNGDTIYVRWKINQYKITFVLGNGNDDVVLTQNYGTAITAPENPVREGYTFGGWDKPVPGTMPAENLTFTAQWKKREYTLTFIDHNGKKVYEKSLKWGAYVEDEYYDANNNVIVSEPFERDGWYDSADKNKTIIEDFSELTMPTRDLTYVLKVKLTASAIGNDFAVENPKNFTYSENNSAVFTISGKTYAGVTYKYEWTILKDNEVYSTETTTDDQSLTLKNLSAGKYFAKVRIVASKEGCGSVDKPPFSADNPLIVDRATISGIEVNDFAMTYGDENAKIKISGNGLREGDVVTYGTDGTTFPLQNLDLSALNAGEHGYYVRIDRGDNYYPYTSKKITVTINKATVSATITPDNDTLTYGGNLPDLTAKIGEETYKIESGKYTLQLKDGMQAITGSVANNVGTYNINKENVNISVLREKYPVDNYNIELIVGTITINKAELTVTVKLDKTVTYGDVSPEIRYTFNGLTPLDTKEEFTVNIVTEYKTKSPAGKDYELTAEVSGKKAGYYTISVNTISFKVAKKAAKITINPIDNIIYGGEVPVLSAKVEDVLDGDSLSYTLEPNYTVGAKPDKYTASVKFNPEAAENKNYLITATGRTFYVVQKSLEIKLDSNVSVGNVAKTYTVEVGSQDLVIGELVKGDVIEGNVSITSSEAGSFVDDKAFQKNIVIKNAADEDVTAYYKIKYDLKVVFVKYTFEINADDKTETYNGEPQNVELVTSNDPNYVITYGMTENECNAESLSELNCINAGTYTIYFKVVDTANGAEEKGSVKFTISPAKVTVKVNDVTITYGETPAFSCTVTGFVGSDTHSGEAVYAVKTLSGEEINIGAGTDAGGYVISVSGLTASNNYNVSFVKGTLTINKKSATVTWTNAENRVYSPDGQSSPTAKYDGKTANLIFTKDGKECEFKNAGTYTVTVADDNNYDLTGSETTKTIVIEKARYTAAPALSLTGSTYAPGNTLGDYALAEGFAWADAGETPVCTKTEYAAKYNMDSDNYEDFEATVTLVLQKATVTLAQKQNLFEFNYDGTSHEIRTTVRYNNIDVTEPYTLTFGKNMFSAAGTHKTTATLTADNFALSDNVVYVKVKGVKVGNKYYTIEDALFNSKPGDTIEFISAAKEVSFAPLDIAKAIYANNAYRTVQAGVTLKLASDEDSSATIGKPTYGAGSARYVDTDSSKIKYKLILNESTVLEVYGNILIQGLLGFSGQAGYQGHTSGNHSHIINNGTINLNNGAKLDLRGYIKGVGKIEARSGATVYSPFVVRDFRGGTSSSGTYLSGVSPFNVYEMPNIQCLYHVKYGATHTAYMDLFASEKHNSVTNNAIASSSAIIILKDGSELTKTYDRDSEKSTITIYGNVELGDLSMEASGATLRMSNVRFPIPWNYTINIGDGIVATSIAVKNDYKIMTGATVNVKKNAKVSITTGTVMVYETFKDVSHGGWVYPDKEPGKLYVEGIIDVIGKYRLDVSYGGISGKIHGINGGKVIIAKRASISHTSKEGYATGLFSNSFVEAATISAKAELVNANGNKITAEKNKTYNYNNGMWK